MAKHEGERPTVGSGATATDCGIAPAQGAEVSQGKAGAAGAAGGTASGALIGTVMGGPPGTIVGAIAGAVGGWFAGHGAAHAANQIAEEDDRDFRTHWESSPNRLADRSWEHARPAYHLGHVAADHPEWSDRQFEAVEADLQKGWTDDLRLAYGDWSTVRPFAQEGWRRRRLRASTGPDARLTMDRSASPADAPATTDQAEGGASWGEHMDGQPAGRVNPAVGLDLGGSPSHQRASFSDPVAALADDVAGGVDPDGRVERTADHADAYVERSIQAADDPAAAREAVSAAESAELAATDETAGAGDSARQRTRGPEIAPPTDYLGNPRP